MQSLPYLTLDKDVRQVRINLNVAPATAPHPRAVAMSGVDARGCSISGATPTALEAYERALATFQSWRSGDRTQSLRRRCRRRPAS